MPCILSNGFFRSSGYFDQNMRGHLFSAWTGHLQQANIQYKTDIARIEVSSFWNGKFMISLSDLHGCSFQYLSNADERLRWQANNLPSDDLCVENAIMLKRFNRYPLIIDPSGQATDYLMNEFKDKKITKTR